MVVLVDYSCLHHYKNIKEKLLKSNAAICFDEMWRFQHLHICKYIKIKVSGLNT